MLKCVRLCVCHQAAGPHPIPTDSLLFCECLMRSRALDSQRGKPARELVHQLALAKYVLCSVVHRRPTRVFSTCSIGVVDHERRCRAVELHVSCCGLGSLLHALWFLLRVSLGVKQSNP